ncbi:MAG: DUF305 domain-containing protein [Thermomicrobiales bacterium]
MHRRHTAAGAALVAVLSTIAIASPSPLAAQSAPPTIACDAAAAASPMSGRGGMKMGTPAAESHAMTGHQLEFDQAYIDMMIPHHASIIAMAEAALPRLSDERLREIARAIIATQQPEIAQLRDDRERWYGEASPMPMDDSMMSAMTELMPAMSGTREDMAFQMDAASQVAAICAAENPDLTFIALTIPHHRMAIESSQIALARAVHPEIADFARRVIAAQQREIETLDQIRAELTGEGTPTGG